MRSPSRPLRHLFGADTAERSPTLRRRFASDRAEVGVGTLIVFIAMVLVAAVAAAVIIGTSGDLQQRAQTTGKEATQEVASNLKVIGIDGERNDTSSNVYNLKFKLTLQAGSQDLDLSDMVIRYSDGTTVRNYQLGGVHPFTLQWVRGEGVDDVMQAGDLVELSLSPISSELAPRTDIEINMIPGTGAPQYIDLRMPPTYSDMLIVPIH